MLYYCHEQAEGVDNGERKNGDGVGGSRGRSKRGPPGGRGGEGVREPRRGEGGGAAHDLRHGHGGREPRDLRRPRRAAPVGRELRGGAAAPGDPLRAEGQGRHLLRTPVGEHHGQGRARREGRALGTRERTARARHGVRGRRQPRPQRLGRALPRGEEDDRPLLRARRGGRAGGAPRARGRTRRLRKGVDSRAELGRLDEGRVRARARPHRPGRAFRRGRQRRRQGLDRRRLPQGRADERLRAHGLPRGDSARKGSPSSAGAGRW